MERSSKHFFAFILYFFVFFFWAKLVMVVKDEELSLKKAFVWFFMKLNALLSEMMNLSQNLNVLNIEDF